MGRGSSKIGGGSGSAGGGVIAKSDYQFSQAESDVIDALGIRKDVDNIVKNVDNADSVLLPASNFAPNVQDYDIQTDYGTGTYWKNPGENFYRVNDPADNNMQTQVQTQAQAVTLIKNGLIQNAVNNKIESIIYTGTSYGIGNPEYTATGLQFADILKKAGFNGV